MTTSIESPRTTVPLHWVAFAALALGQLLIDVDDAVLNIALPTIARDLGIGVDLLPWVINTYLLCFGGLLLLGGRLADRFGHRRMLLTGMALFVAASLGGALAPNGGAIILARAGQGLTAALVAPAAMSLLVSTFPEPEARAKALGLWGAVTGGGALVGLIIGGLVTETLGWRWLFAGNAVLALLVGASVRTLLPGSTTDRRVRIEPIGAIAATAGLVIALQGLDGAQTHGWTSGRTLAGFAAALALIAVAILVQRNHPDPLIPRELLRNRSVMVADTCALLTGAGMLVTFFFISLQMQQVLGYSPLRTAVCYLPMIVVLIGAAGLGSSGVVRIGSRPVLASGMVVCAVGLALLGRLGLRGAHVHYVGGLLPGLLVAGIGLGMAFVALTVAAVPGGEGSSDSGAASGLYNTAAQLGGALGIAILTTVSSARTRTLIAGGHDVIAATTSGRQIALYAGAGLLAIGAIAALLMPRETGRKAQQDT